MKKLAQTFTKWLNQLSLFVVLLIIGSNFISNLNAQTFDFASYTNTTINGKASVQTTVSGITLTVESASNGTSVINGGGYGGTSGNLVLKNKAGTNTDDIPMVFTFSSSVDISSLRLTTNFIYDGPNWTARFTPTGGSNSNVDISTNANNGSDVSLNWTGVTSFTITRVDGASMNRAAPAVDNINFSVAVMNTTPTVTTTAASSITTTTATLGGEVTDNGGDTVTERGIVYNTTGIPTTADIKVQIGSGDGSFSDEITGLTPGTQYYVRAYAINSEGTSYGSEVNFTTSAASSSFTFDWEANVSGLGTQSASQQVNAETLEVVATTTDIFSGFAIYGAAANGSEAISSHDYNVLLETKWRFSLAGNKTFDLTSIRLFENYSVPTTLTFTSSKGTTTFSLTGDQNTVFDISSDGNAADFQEITYFEITGQITGANPYTGNHFAIQADDIIIENITDAPIITTPTVTTIGASDITTTAATLGGNVTDNGGETVTDRGIVYNTSGTPTTADTKVTIGSGDGSFSDEVTGLTMGTQYYVRAYAINNEGTSYGSEESFTTLSDLVCTGDNWTAQQTAENNDWRSVTYGNGKFVAVARSGTNRVMTSSDGENWTAHPAAENNLWQSVTYGHGKFVAVATNGTNQVMTSTDGENWTAQSAVENNNWLSVTYGNGKFVAVARSGTNRVMTSTDGENWTAQSAAEYNNWNSLTYGNGKFVAVAGFGTNRVMTSSDGENWTAHSAIENNYWISVSYGNGKFVAISLDGVDRVMTSPDGENWTAQQAAENNEWRSVTYGNGKFVSVAGDGTNQVMVSSCEAPCTDPTAFALDNVTTESVDLTWTSGDSETEWEVIYGAPNFDPDAEGTTQTVNTDPELTLSGLSLGTNYEVYVRAICSVDDESDWVGPLSFTTNSYMPSSNILYVNTNASGNGNGSSWSNAIPELADALKWAKENEDPNWATTPLQIWVAAGTYKPMYSPEDGNFGNDAGRDNTFLMINNVQLYGGFAGTEATLSERDIENNETILSGDIDGDDVVTGTGSTLSITNNTENNYHVIISAGAIGAAKLDGFTIAGGNATGTSYTIVNGYALYQNVGGGISNYNASPLIVNTAIIGNTADAGGGISNNNMYTTLTNVIIHKNIANFGGGMYNSNSNSLLTNVTLSGNNAIEGTEPEVACSTYVTQAQCASGGSDCVWNFFDEICEGAGSVGGIGGGIYNINSSNITLTNSILLGNTAITSDPGIYNEISSITITYSLIQGYTDNTNGNLDATGITATDIFNDPTNGDYSLKSTSPAVNAGDNVAYTNSGGDLTNDVDLVGNPRVFQNTIDMGAYESQIAIITPVNNILYVDKDATGIGSGSSWSDAIPELADALKWTKENEDPNWATTPLQVWVAAGTYKPMYSPEDSNFGSDAGRENTFLLVNNVKLYGGFAGTETILSQRDLGNNETILSGDFNDDDAISGSGSGLTFSNNSENAYHVVAAVGSLGSASLDGFTVSGGNSTGGSSLAVNSYSIDVERGAGIFTRQTDMEFSNLTVKHNYSNQHGGGFYLDFSNIVVKNTLFAENRAQADGGAIVSFNNSSQLVNLTLANNYAANSSGIFHAGSGTPEVYNSIVWNTSSGISYENSLITGSSNTADGNINATGLSETDIFTDSANGDYSLLEASSAVDAGSNTAYTNAGGDLITDVDVEGNLRLIGTAIDLGAFEHQLEGYVYQNNNWIPMQPEGNALATDNLYVYNGTTSLTADLEVNNVEVMSGANLDIENVLKVNGDFENNGTVTFKSTATQDGELDEFTGNITGTGSFVVERFNIDQRSYRMLTSSVNSNESIHTNWQEGADSSTDNPNPGFGTHITGSTIDQQNGFDGTATGNASMYLINSATQGFEAVANTDNTNLVAGQPYFMYIRGDRSIDLTATTANQGSTSTILRATGMLVTGNQQQQFTINNDGDYLMFGNPYQSAIDMSSVIANSNNVNGAFYYVYDPNVGEFGGYVTYDFSLGSTVPTSQADQYLQPGQGAQIAGNTAGTVTLNFAEADKAPGNHSNTSKMNTNFAGIKAGLYTTDNFQNGAYAHDGFVVSFDGSNQITQEDATKPMNLGENLGISKEGKTLSIEKREMPQATDVIQLFTNNYNSQEYTLTLKVTGLTGVTAYFNDSYTGTSTQLNEGMNSLSILVDQGIEASIAENRFHISFDSESLSTKEESYFSLSLYPNPTRDGNFSITSTELSDQAVILTVTDLLGREVIKKQVKFNGNNLNIDANEKLTSGVYLINITQGSRTQTVKLIKE